MFEFVMGEAILPEGAQIHERMAVRAVFMDGDKIRVVETNKGDYKLPGGGIKPGETEEEALKREIREEIGWAHVHVERQLGTVIEQQTDLFDPGTYFRMISHYYACEPEDQEDCGQTLDDYEEELEFTPAWVSLPDVIERNRQLLQRSAASVNPWVERETNVFEKLDRIRRGVTSIYFVRHAKPVYTADERMRPLSEEGRSDCLEVEQALSTVDLDICYCSPYERSMETIRGSARFHGLRIHTDERLRERKAGPGGNVRELMQLRWADFAFCEEGGESLGMTQARNVEAVCDILDRHQGEAVLIGTHGTALSTVIHYYEPAYLCDSFFQMIDYMPYIVRLDFEGRTYKGREDILIIKKVYGL